jgi:integrase
VQPDVRLIAAVKVENNDGQLVRRFRPLEFVVKGRDRGGLTKESSELAQKASGFYLRFSDAEYQAANGLKSAQRLVPVGDQLENAIRAYQNQKFDLERESSGIEVVKPVIHAGAISAAVKTLEADLDAKAEAWSKGASKDKLSPGTVRKYKRFARVFRDNIGVSDFKELTGSHILRLKQFLRNSTRGEGAHDRTVADFLRWLDSFLQTNNVKLVRGEESLPGDTSDRGLIQAKDFPVLTKAEKRSKKAEKYSENEIAQLMGAADKDERDLLETFLQTGMRRSEVANLRWSWIDFDREIIDIQDALPDFRLKDYEARWTPLSPELKSLLLARKKRLGGQPNDVVFPKKSGGVDDHLDRVLQSVASKVSDAGVTIKGKIELHRFRKTWATTMLSHYPINKVRQWGGWADLTTLQIYLADAEKDEVDTSAMTQAFKKKKI